jgi:TolB protein
LAQYLAMLLIRLRRALLAGVATFVWVTVIVLLLGALTHGLDGVLGLGTHRSGASDLVRMNVNGTGRTVLIAGDGKGHWGPAWSPDGRSFVYTLGDPTTNVGQLELARSNGRDERPLTRDERNNYLPAWSRDGKEIAYITQQGGNTATADLAVVSASGAGSRRLTHNHVWEYGASWSPDGKRIAYGSKARGAWHVWTVGADGSYAQIVAGTAGGNAPDWSPSGRSIVFTSDRTGTDNLYVVPATGGAARRLTTGSCHSDNPRWSPDGRRIVFDRFCGHGWNDVEVMNADGSHVVNLTRSANLEEEVPAWLPDGKHVGFTVFQIERDSLWPDATLRSLLIGLFFGILAAAAVLFWRR